MTDLVDVRLEPPPVPMRLRPVEGRFSGDAFGFFAFVLGGGFLQLITVGFYRFWLLTDIRRRLWSATSFDGDALEYVGRGRDLFIGFLIAMAILAPAFLAYFLVGLEIERVRAFASLPLYAFLYVFGQYATYRARRYRLSRTVWRGVRFWMEAAAWGYAARSCALIVVSFLTLGLFNPWRLAALERFKLARTRFGDIPARFEGKGFELFKAAILIWIAGIVVIAASIGLFIFEIVTRVRGAPVGPAGAITSVVTALGGPLIVYAVLWPLYQAIEWRWFLRGVRIGEARLDCRLRPMRVVVLQMAFLALSAAAALALGAFEGLLYWALRRHGHEAIFANEAVGVAALAANYLTVLTLVGAIYRTFLQHQLWRRIVESLTVRGLATLAAARQAGAASDALGEGMLDGLDMGGF